MQHPPVQPLSGWTTVDSGLRTFKEAPLTLSSDLGDPGSPDRAPLLLVSAPGAVGKTTLAKQIAFHTGSIYLDLAIGTAKEFVETVCKTILKERGIGMPKDDDMPALVKLTVDSLPVVPGGIEDPARWKRTTRQLVNNISSLGRSLAELRNAFGTGHGRPAGNVGLNTHHARLAVQMATAVGVFLYEVHEGHPVSG